MSSDPRERMSPGLRVTTYTVCGILWLSGCAWLVLHLFFPQQAQFGASPNPWEPQVMRVHGWLAAGGVFLLGWVSARHITERWPLYRSRPSGLFLTTLAAFLVLTGYALYYTTERLHDVAATTHEILGGAGIFLAVIHWRRNGFRRPK